ncbi:MAG: hypothetical protein H0V61_03860 [Chitinophagales bacterium]|jgi:hypothetical protein|nr:hypothetical protein [Chitinophagales bacterium]
MSSLKVSRAFLDGPVANIINQATKVATSMNGNENFPIPPISPGGLQSVVNDLKLMETKAKDNKQQHIINRDVALADVQDFLLQNATYVENASKNDLVILLSSGFEAQQKP